jgi:hypothetical protein
MSVTVITVDHPAAQTTYVFVNGATITGGLPYVTVSIAVRMS